LFPGSGRKFSLIIDLKLYQYQDFIAQQQPTYKTVISFLVTHKKLVPADGKGQT